MEDIVRALRLAPLNPLPATKESDSQTGERVDVDSPMCAGEDEDDDDDDDTLVDPVGDLIEDEVAVVDFHMEESTIIYECIEKYLDVLNRDQRLRPEITPEEKMLDETLCFESDNVKSKNLINNYLCLIIKPKPCRISKRRTAPPTAALSNRKLKRKLYADFQRKYQKKRKAAFDGLFSDNSISDDLSHVGMCSLFGHIFFAEGV